MKIIDFDENVFLAISDRTDGNMKNPQLAHWANDEILESRRKFFMKSSISVSKCALIRADYGNTDFAKYIFLSELDDYALSLPNDKIPATDGLATKRTHLGIFLPLADCLGVVIFDTKTKKLMVVHSGRHNLEQKGLVRAIDFLHDSGSKSEDLKVWLSPGAGKKNYPVHKFEGKSLTQIAKEQLLSMDVKDITSENIDTTIDKNYFSHSQGDRNERHAILAYIK